MVQDGYKMKKTKYKKTKTLNHPFADKNGFVFEHRLVVEAYIKRYLKPKEIVHHINEIKGDNMIENLMLFKNQKEHTKFHTKLLQHGMTNPIRRQIQNRWDKHSVLI